MVDWECLQGCTRRIGRASQTISHSDSIRNVPGQADKAWHKSGDSTIPHNMSEKAQQEWLEKACMDDKVLESDSWQQTDTQSWWEKKTALACWCIYFPVHPDYCSHTGATPWERVLQNHPSAETEYEYQKFYQHRSGSCRWGRSLLWTQLFLKQQSYPVEDYILYQDNNSVILLESNSRKSTRERLDILL